MAMDIFDLIKSEEQRQEQTITLIPSENYTSFDVRQALSSKLSNKYSEGYSGRRYYQGNSIVDEIESLAVENAKKLFKTPHANVQPYSGSPANSAVFFGLLSPSDTIMGLSLSSGGHLTHGHPKITFSGKFFNSVQYEVGEDGFIDYSEVDRLAKVNKPKLIVAGTTAYTRVLDWQRFAEIADSVGAFLLADISHIAGLVVSGVHPSPANWAHIITTTTHKTLRGPRGAIVMATEKGIGKDPDIAKKIDRAVFPGLQGGPHNNQTAAIAIALEEAMKPEFMEYGKKVVENAKVLAGKLLDFGFDLVSGGTDNHLMLVDLRSKKISGKDAAILLENAGIVTNYNAVPFDPNPPANPSGIRIGTPAVTTRGMGEVEMVQIAEWIHTVISKNKTEEVLSEVQMMCSKFKTP